MASYDDELLKAASKLLERSSGQRGKLPTARVRRSISTSYYALFHFILEEVGRKVAGSSNALRVRRRVLARTISHSGMKSALEQVRGATVGVKALSFFERDGATAPPPMFAKELARTFADAQKKRHDADYDLNEPLSETDARLLRRRIRRVIRRWRDATSLADRDFKHALCLLILMNGKLRGD